MLWKMSGECEASFMLLNHSGLYLVLHISFELWQELFWVTNLIPTQWIILISCSGHLYMPRNEQIGSRFNLFPCFCCYFFSSHCYSFQTKSKQERKQLPRWKGPLCPSVAQQAACFFFFCWAERWGGPSKELWVMGIILKSLSQSFKGGDGSADRMYHYTREGWFKLKLKLTA